MIQKLLLDQEEVFTSSISLIPSENYSFYEDFKLVFNNDINNRYSFFSNPVFSSAFPWHKSVQEIEKYVTLKLSTLFKAEYINISPLSWMNALEIFFMSMWKANDAVAIVSPKNGWHVSTAKIAHNIGYNIIDIPFTEKNIIDYQSLESLCNIHNIKFIYIDQMNWVTPVSMKPLEHIQIPKYYDISHNAAFIASWHHANPLKDGYNCFGGSTHKSFPGPQKAFFASNNKNIHDKLSNKTLSSISNNHISNIAFLGIVLERMEKHWKNYAESIIINNRYFAHKLEEMWASILWNNDDCSDNHQLFFFFAENNDLLHSALNVIWIYTNFLPLPFAHKKVMWFRTWVQELTFLWWKQQELDILLWIMKDILDGEVDIEASQKKVKILKEALLHKFNCLYD